MVRVDLTRARMELRGERFEAFDSVVSTIQSFVRERTGLELPVEFTATQGAEVSLALVESCAGIASRSDSGEFVHDGYDISSVGDSGLLVRSALLRGIVFGVGELLRNSRVREGILEFTGAPGRRDPEFGFRNWVYYDIASRAEKVASEVVPALALDYRFSSVSYCTFDKGVVGPEATLANTFPGFSRPFKEHEQQIQARRDRCQLFIDAAKSYGLDVYAGWAPLDFPGYVHDFIAREFPGLLARAYGGSSDWPPYEWQERPKYCPSVPFLWEIWEDALHEFLQVHPQLDGLVMSFYDGNQIGCGCAKCKDYAYSDRYIDIVKRVNRVAQCYNKKLLLYDWLPGALSANPGYEVFWKNLREYAEDYPNLIVSCFETAGDFFPPHGPHPRVGDYPKHVPSFQLWPEYRGWGRVPDWMVNHLSRRVKYFRDKGAYGFAAIEGRLDDRMNAVNFDALGKLMWDSEADPVEIGHFYCERVFGEGTAPLADVLEQSFEAKCKYLYVNGIKFNAHSNIEYDLRTFEEVYVRYDSAPFYPDREERLSITSQNIRRILEEKDDAVAISERMLEDFSSIEERLSDSDSEMLRRHLQWNLEYAKLFRGFTRCFFNLKLFADQLASAAVADKSVADEVLSGAMEMGLQYALLPGSPQYGDYVYYDEGFPWSCPDLSSLIDQLKTAASILRKLESVSDITVLGQGESADALRQLFIPFTSTYDISEAVRSAKVLVIDRGVTGLASAHMDLLLEYVAKGGGLFFHNPDIRNLDAAALPGKVSFNVCQYSSVKVIEPGHPLVGSRLDLGPEPIFYFGSTSAYLTATEFNPGIRSYAAADNTYRTITYPGVLFEREIESGRILFDMIPENRELYIRGIDYLMDE